MRYQSRRANRLRRPRSRVTISRSNGVFVHWTAGPISQSVRQIQDFHMGTRGWSDIAYSWLVDIDGVIHEGRGWGVAGAHTEGYNSSTHAVCAILGPGTEPSAAQLDGVATVIAEHDRRYGAGFVQPHNAVNSTACPGPDLTTYVNDEGYKSPAMSAEEFYRRLGVAVAEVNKAAKRPRAWRVVHYKRLLGVPRRHRHPVMTVATRRKIRAFQEFMGLPSTGRFDRTTAIWIEFAAL